MLFIQSYLKILLAFIILMFSSSVFAKTKQKHTSEREKAAQAFLHAHDHSKKLHTIYADHNWHALDIVKVERALKVPSQIHGHKDLSSWSCGPNSAARTYELLSLEICSAHKQCDVMTHHSAYEKEYKRFAEHFPKTFGYPGTSGGKKLSASIAASGLATFVGYGHGDLITKATLSAMITLAGISPYLLGYLGGNVGAMPQWYAEHLTSLLEHKSFGVHQLVKSKFSEILAEIKEAIHNHTPVIPLVVFDVTAWHYFVIIGYNDKTSEVLIMDTDSTVATYSYHNLERLMNPGYLRDDTMATYMLASLVGKATKFGIYNAIAFSHSPAPSQAPSRK